VWQAIQHHKNALFQLRVQALWHGGHAQHVQCGWLGWLGQLVWSRCHRPKHTRFCGTDTPSTALIDTQVL
jgi:hypothetical protein